MSSRITVTNMDEFDNLQELEAAYNISDVETIIYILRNFENWLKTHYQYNFYVDIILLAYSDYSPFSGTSMKVLTRLVEDGLIKRIDGDFLLPDDQGMAYVNYNPSRSIMVTWLYGSNSGNDSGDSSKDNVQGRGLQLRHSFYHNIFEIVDVSDVHITPFNTLHYQFDGERLIYRDGRLESTEIYDHGIEQKRQLYQ